MKPFELFVSGTYPLSKTIYAENLQQALAKARKDEIQEGDWDMYPIFQGEKQVDTYVKVAGEKKKRRVNIFNPEFKGER